MILESILTCPLCGHVKTGTMPTDACQVGFDESGEVCGFVPRVPES